MSHQGFVAEETGRPSSCSAAAGGSRAAQGVGCCAARAGVRHAGRQGQLLELASGRRCLGLGGALRCIALGMHRHIGAPPTPPRPRPPALVSLWETRCSRNASPSLMANTASSAHRCLLSSCQLLRASSQVSVGGSRLQLRFSGAGAAPSVAPASLWGEIIRWARQNRSGPQRTGVGVLTCLMPPGRASCQRWGGCGARLRTWHSCGNRRLYQLGRTRRAAAVGGLMARCVGRCGRWGDRDRSPRRQLVESAQALPPEGCSVPAGGAESQLRGPSPGLQGGGPGSIRCELHSVLFAVVVYNAAPIHRTGGQRQNAGCVEPSS